MRNLTNGERWAFGSAIGAALIGALATLLAAVIAKGCPGSDQMDARTIDAGIADALIVDAGGTDAGVVDGGRVDAGRKPRPDAALLPDAPPPPPPPVPEYVAFCDDPHARYRLYEDATVSPGQLFVEVHNQWPHDDVKFEVWSDNTGAALRIQAPNGPVTRGSRATISNIERLVWFGHTPCPRGGGLNRRLDPIRGWHLDFLRID
jgi:hypothetical protein